MKEPDLIPVILAVASLLSPLIGIMFLIKRLTKRQDEQHKQTHALLKQISEKLNDRVGV